MTFLKVLRLVVFGGVTLLSLVVLGSSSFLNAKSSPMFHFTMFTFPFAMSLITLLVIPTITIIERATRNKRNSRLGQLSTVTFELPLLTLFLLLWFICAHTGISEFFGPFRHCNRGQGVGVMSAGLDVPSHCKIVAVVHGSEWLSCFGFLIICAFTALFSLLALLRQGRNIFILRLSDLTITGLPHAEHGTNNQKMIH
ncbi:hypothetical protein CVT25_005932 [Psilocybe cyanescens]|uniref:MARVEL domain-containing protein n=1 Tax=Psilocybe cyanescens TaxID=93625 RepID=A0A409VSL6_PSICY|nr:hypothetical protein CVT25_005932 [Psilocybe cyanescens]